MAYNVLYYCVSGHNIEDNINNEIKVTEHIEYNVMQNTYV